MGIEPTQYIRQNSANPAPRGAKSGAVTPTVPDTDPLLAALIDAWPTLPEPIQAGIIAMVRATGG